MNLREIEGGVNDCYWNFRGKCTNPAITEVWFSKNKSPSRDWDSKLGCCYTQIGVPQCGGYLQQGYIDSTYARNRRLGIEILKMFGLVKLSKLLKGDLK